MWEKGKKQKKGLEKTQKGSENLFQTKKKHGGVGEKGKKKKK